MASLSVPVRTVVPSIHPSSSTAVACTRLGLHYGCCHYFRQPPFRLLVHAHAGHPRGRPCGVPCRSNRGRRGSKHGRPRALAGAMGSPLRVSGPALRRKTLASKNLAQLEGWLLLKNARGAYGHVGQSRPPSWQVGHCANSPSFLFKTLSAVLFAFLIASMVGGSPLISPRVARTTWTSSCPSTRFISPNQRRTLG